MFWFLRCLEERRYATRPGGSDIYAVELWQSDAVFPKPRNGITRKCQGFSGRSVRAGRGGGLEVKHDQNWGGQLSASDQKFIAITSNTDYTGLL
jgi:hypothetical protein